MLDVIYGLFGGRENIRRLAAFASDPLQFLRARAIPPILGAIFGFVFDVSTIIAQPFQSVIAALGTVSAALSLALTSVTSPITGALARSAGLLVDITAPFGPLQPFALAGVGIGLSYAAIALAVRTGRALADSIPIVSGLETFIFG